MPPLFDRLDRPDRLPHALRRRPRVAWGVTRTAALALALAATGLAACTGTRMLAHPTLEIRSPSGRELGVSTTHGIVFLGRTVRSGEIDVTAWFGDGPNVERTLVEPVAEDLYTAEVEIRLPAVPIDFRDPEPGEQLLLIGREGRDLWEEHVIVRSHAAVTGVLIDVPERLSSAPDQVGAGLYVLPEGERLKMRLVGLVSGRITLETASGRSEYLTVVGAHDLWRLVTRPRAARPSQRWIYREDVL